MVNSVVIINDIFDLCMISLFLIVFCLDLCLHVRCLVICLFAVIVGCLFVISVGISFGFVCLFLVVANVFLVGVVFLFWLLGGFIVNWFW